MPFDLKSVLYGALITAVVAGFLGLFFARLKKSEPTTSEEAREIAQIVADKMAVTLRKEIQAVANDAEKNRAESVRQYNEVRGDFKSLGESMLAAVTRQDDRLSELTMHLLQQRGDKK